MQDTASPGPAAQWIVAARPWSFTASGMAVCFGTAAAWAAGAAAFHPWRFLLALAGMLILHGAANMLSDVHDHRHGLDGVPFPTSGAIVRGWLTDRQEERAAWGLVALGSAIGLLLAVLAGPAVLWIGLAGVAVGTGYTFLKYRALGDLAVFLDFGLLGSAGAWAVQAGRFSWLPLLWAAPMSLHVVAILHANNWRDIAGDSGSGLRTVASLLGDRGSLHYYAMLLFAPFGLVAAFAAVPRLLPLPLRPMPWTFALVLLALPRAFTLWGRARRRHAPREPLDFLALDGATAQLHLLFGLLCTAAAVAGRRWG